MWSMWLYVLERIRCEWECSKDFWWKNVLHVLIHSGERMCIPKLGHGKLNLFFHNIDRFLKCLKPRHLNIQINFNYQIQVQIQSNFKSKSKSKSIWIIESKSKSKSKMSLNPNSNPNPFELLNPSPNPNPWHL